jgi:hypothetical protein
MGDAGLVAGRRIGEWQARLIGKIGAKKLATNTRRQRPGALRVKTSSSERARACGGHKSGESARAPCGRSVAAAGRRTLGEEKASELLTPQEIFVKRLDASSSEGVCCCQG